jgi:DNA-binding transcriptional LysR family regulator
MNRKSINLDWNKVKAFLVTAEEGSLSKAANSLNMNQTTVGRQVASLEQELEVILFERVGKGIELTPAGLELLGDARKMDFAANQLSLKAAGKTTEIEGTVCITGSESTSIFILPEILEKLKVKYPKINIVIIADNKSNNLLRREADIAIRHYRPESGDLIIKKIRDDKAYLYASSKYLKKIKPIKNISDLNKAQFIGFIENTDYISGMKSIGLDLTRENFSVYSQNHILHYELMKNGMGIGVLPEYIGSKEKDLVKVLKKLPAIPMQTWLVVHRELNTSIKVRKVFDFLANELKSFK